MLISLLLGGREGANEGILSSTWELLPDFTQDNDCERLFGGRRNEPPRNNGPIIILLT